MMAPWFLALDSRRVFVPEPQHELVQEVPVVGELGLPAAGQEQPGVVVVQPDAVSMPVLPVV